MTTARTTTDPSVSRVAYAVLAITVAAGAFLLDAVTPATLNPAILAPIALVVAAWTRSRLFVWCLAAAIIVGSYVGLMLGPPPSDQPSWAFLWANRTLVAIAALGIAFLVDSWVRFDAALAESRVSLAARNEALEATNHELRTREEEVARQNEELQSQSEEVERQSEELRITNDELASREAMLAQLLTLSRTLATELTSDEVMATICHSLTALLGNGADASALLLRHGDELRMHCHVGFGDDGPKDSHLPYANSFAALVVARGQAGFLDDVSLRPDLRLPEPRDGEPFRSVLAAPLSSRGQAIGTLEVYSRRPERWDEEHITLITSMAAQGSISLETARLFEELARERQRFETVFRSLPLCVLVAEDAQCERVSGNPAAAALFTTTLDENFSPFVLHGKRVRSAMLQDGQVLLPHEHPLARAVRGGLELPPEELEIVFPSGRRMIVLASAAPFFDGEGRVSGGVCAFADITAQKRLERELEARRRESEEASVRKTRFLAAVSHDIRTPANAIRLQAELIKRSASTPAIAGKVPELALQLQVNAIALVDLVGEVLDLTHFDTGKTELHETEFSLGDVVAEECRQLTPVAESKGLVLRCERIDPRLWVRTDRVKLGRVLGNLTENAIKFTDRGEIVLNVRHTPSREVALAVRDTGAGIAPDQQARVFDEFFQLRNPERDRAKGRGLGLAICKRLVDAMGGQLTVESAPGAGSTFTVVLPPSVVVPVPDMKPLRSAAAAAPGNEGSESRLHGVRILLVEDHDDNRIATAEILRHEGATVLEAARGGEALRALADEPHLILLDLMLPDLDGVEVLRRIRARPPSSLRAVVVLTGDSVSRGADEIRRLGADALLAKPVDPDTLVERLRRLVLPQ